MLLLWFLTEETEGKWCVYYNLKTTFFTIHMMNSEVQLAMKAVKHSTERYAN